MDPLEEYEVVKLEDSIEDDELGEADDSKVVVFEDSVNELP